MGYQKIDSSSSVVFLSLALLVKLIRTPFLIQGHPPATLLGLLFSSRAMYQNPMLNSTSTEQGRITNWSDRGWEAGWFASSALLWDQLGIVSLSLLFVLVCLHCPFIFGTCNKTGSKTLTDIKEKIALDSIDVHIVAWTTKLPILARRANRVCLGSHQSPICAPLTLLHT